MAIRNALPFEFLPRWPDLRRFFAGAEAAEDGAIGQEVLSWLEQRDRELEDFLSSLSGGGGVIHLPVLYGIAPDTTGTGNGSARPEKVVSSAAQTANTPKASVVQLLFDSATDQHWFWCFGLPDDYAAAGELRLHWGAKVASGDIVWKAGVARGDLDSSAFLAADSSGAVAVPSTVGATKATTIPLTVTGVTAGATIVVFVGRDADAGSDTAAGDATLLDAFFEYRPA